MKHKDESQFISELFNHSQTQHNTHNTGRRNHSNTSPPAQRATPITTLVSATDTYRTQYLYSYTKHGECSFLQAQSKRCLYGNSNATRSWGDNNSCLDIGTNGGCSRRGVGGSASSIHTNSTSSQIHTGGKRYSL